MRRVKVREIAIGQTIALDVSNLHGQVILRAGTVLEPRHRTLLKAWGIPEVSIEGDAPSTTAPADAQNGASSATENLDPLDGQDANHPALAELVAIIARLADKTQQERKEQAAEALTGVTSGSRPPGPPVSAETIVGRASTLASLPTIYFHVDRAINHPTGSTADIAKVLGSDQALSARLLRIANSAFYGFPRRVESLDEAVRIIGTRQLHDLVLATVVLTQFRGVDPRVVSMASFWRHSLACGIAARALAGLRRESNVERFFVAGLLHDIGSLVLYQQLPDRARIALARHRETNMSLDETERIVIGCDHGQVGAALMLMWKLPEFYREAALNHHGMGPRPHTVGTALVHVADVLVAGLALGSNGEARLPRFSTEAWDVLALPPSSLDHAAEETLSLLAEAQRLFLKEEGAT